MLRSAWVVVVVACDVAELGPALDARPGDVTPSPTDVATAAPPDAAPTIVIEREPCGPCDAARTRRCEAGACGDWSACEPGVCRPRGLLCGLRVDDTLGRCQGHYPALSCPEGWAPVLVVASGDLLTTCALDIGNCEGATCDPTRLPSTAVCGIWHNGSLTGTGCDGVTPAEGGCPLGMAWSGKTDYGSVAGVGVQVCVAAASERPVEGLCGWSHTRSTRSGDGRFWCEAASVGTCPTACELFGPTDTGAGTGEGWMTCVCP